MPRKQVSSINEDFDFKLLITIAKQNVWWFFTFMVVSSLIATLILRYTAPVYESTAVIKFAVENKAGDVLEQMNSNREFSYDNIRIAGDIELIKSKIIVQRALNRLPLNISYFSKGAVLEFELYDQSPFLVEYHIKDSVIIGHSFDIEFIDQHKITLNYPVNNLERATGSFSVDNWFSTPLADIRVTLKDYNNILMHKAELQKDGYYFVFNNKNLLVDRIVSRLNVIPLNMEAKTIEIRYRDENNRKAADIVQNVANQFIIYDVERSSEATGKILEFIDRTIASINVELSNSESSIEQFKRTNKIISPDNSINEVSGRMHELQIELETINYELYLFKQIKTADDDSQQDLSKFILSISGTTKDNAVIMQLDKLKQLSDERDLIQTQSTTRSDIYKIISQKIINQKEILKNTIANEEARLLSQQRLLVSKLKEYDAKFGLIPKQQAEYGRLQRFFNINEKFYSLLLEKKAEFSITKAGYVPQHIILQEAKNNTPPVSPNRSLIISSCLLVGFLLSFLLIITRYLLYNEINALEEVAMYTDAALLGIVPKYKREIPVSQLLVDKNPKSVISESFRSIRTNLQFISNEDGPKLMAVTSTISGEGKTL